MGQFKATATVVGVLSILVGGYLWVAGIVSEHVQEPYMDEIFHVPMTQRYLKGDYAYWDPKITTFPGSYVLGVGYCLVTGQMERCLAGPEALRELNAVIGALTVLLVFDIVTRLHPTSSFASRAMQTALVSLWPLQLFFSFLFYTDAASTFCVLLTYDLCLLAVGSDDESVAGPPGMAKASRAGPDDAHEPPSTRPVTLGARGRLALLAASCTGAAAVGCRQTNAVWVAFCVGVVLVRLTRRSAGLPKTASLARVLLAALPRVGPLLGILAPLVAIVVSFAAFVVWNKGIVIGDRSHHTMVAHVPQLFYFVTIACCCLAGDLLRPQGVELLATAMLKATYTPRRLAISGLAAVAVALCIYHLSYMHPFTLADNRHYVFYLCKDIFCKWWWVKYAFIPVYLLSGLHLAQRLGETQSRARSEVYVIAVALVLVPAQLIEFRYYTVPLFVLLMHVRVSVPTAVVGCTSLLIVNAVTMWAFLRRPFAWADGSMARFMW